MRKILAAMCTIICALGLLTMPVSAATIQGITVDDSKVLTPSTGQYTATLTGVTNGQTVLFFGLKGVHTGVTDLMPTKNTLVQIGEATVTNGSASVTFALKTLGLTSDIPVSTIFATGGGLSTPQIVGYVDATKYAWGDLNENGNIRADDALMALRIALQSTYRAQVREDIQYLSRVRGNATTTAADALYILRKALQVGVKFPVES